MPATRAPEAVAFTVTTDFGAGAIPTSGAGVTALERHQLMPAAYDGATVGYRVDHVTALEYQVGLGVYDADTNTISRPTGSILLSSAGTGINETFDPGPKRVLIVPTGADFESILAALAALPATHQAVTEAAAVAGYAITRSSANILVELDQDLDPTSGTYVLPTSALTGDVVRVVRHGGGLGLWSRTGTGADSSDVLRGRDDLIEYQWSGSAWVRVLLREQQVLRVNQATYTVSGGDHLLDLVFHSTPCTVTLPNTLGTRTRFRLVQEGAAVVTVTLASGALSTPTTAPPLATAGDGTALAVTVIGNATGTAARYRLMLEHPVPQVGATLDGGTFNPAAVDLSGDKEYAPITQSGDWAFALAAVTEVPGALVSVEVTGTLDAGNTITYSADFEEINGGSLTAGDYAGFNGPRRLMITWSATQGNKALVALGGATGGGGGTWGSIEGTLSEQDDLNTALNAKAAVAPVISTQSGSFALETVLAAGTASNRHNTIVQLTGAVDQEVDMAGMTADAIVVVTEDYGRGGVPQIEVVQKVIKSVTGMRVPGHPDAAWNPFHQRAFLAPWGAARVEYWHSPLRIRVTGSVMQLPYGPGINPVDLSPLSIDFDMLAAGKLDAATPAGKITTWRDTLGLITGGVTQLTDANKPPVLGTAGTKDYRANFDNFSIGAGVSLQSTDCPNLPGAGVTFWYVGGMGVRASGSSAAHLFGTVVPNNLGMYMSSTAHSVSARSSSQLAFLNDFDWRDGSKIASAASFNSDGTVVHVGFHSVRGAERGNATWTPADIDPNFIRLGNSNITDKVGFLQQIGFAPVPSTELQLFSIVRSLTLKWMD